MLRVKSTKAIQDARVEIGCQKEKIKYHSILAIRITRRRPTRRRPIRRTGQFDIGKFVECQLVERDNLSSRDLRNGLNDGPR